MMRGSLRRRLFLVVLLAVIPAFVVHVVVQVVNDLAVARARASSGVADVASAAVPLLQGALIVGDLATAQEALDNLMRHDQFRRLRLLDERGEKILMEGRATRQPQAGQAPAWFAAWLDARFAEQRFAVNGGGYTYGILAVEPSPSALVADLWRRLWSASLLWLLTLGLSLALLAATLRRGLSPLEHLAEAARRLGDGDLACRAPVGDVPELAATAEAFNGMADKLADMRARQETRVRQATRELENLIARIPAGVYKLRIAPDDSMRFDYVSPRWCDQLELDAETAYSDPRSPMSRVHPDEVEGFLREFDQVKTSLRPFFWEGRMREGLRAQWMRIEAVPTRLPDGVVLWDGIQYDITATKVREAELDHIAHYDALTGLPNRTLLADRLRQAIAHADRAGGALAVCYLDLDGFKPVNDALGHEAGDALLVEIARRLHGAVRGGDTVARIGGDEFVLLLADMSGVEEFEVTLRRVLNAVEAPFTVLGQRVTVSVSIGIALYPRDEGDPDLLMRHADQAMYQAKQAGRGKYIFFDASLESAARHHREMLAQIESGMNGRQFELYYEPKVNMRLGTVVGFEALIRWRHPERGLLSPKDFLPLIEDNDLIVALGEWVIDQALTQLGAWRRQGHDVTVSVNVAPRQLQHPGFIERLRQLLAIHADAPPERLEIEILETAALADTEHFAELIHACKRMGVSFALDDFGTGYSSLTYLKTLPAQTLKIDQSFVRDMLTDANDLAIVEGVIGLTEVFRRRVIAEGVETSKHCALLLNMGCELAQGYGIARPMPAGEVDAWLRDWKPDPAWSSVECCDWPQEDLPLVIAENNHLAWIQALSAYLAGELAEPPEMHPSHCRFGQWHLGPGRRRYARLAEFGAISEVHDRVHALGGELVALAAQGSLEAARARLPELLALRDELLAGLQSLKSAAAKSSTQ